MGGRERAKWVKRVRRYKFPDIKYVSHGDVLYSMVTLVNNTVLHICKLLKEQLLKVLTRRKKNEW